MRVFIGSEALAAGAVSRYELCSAYDRLLPDVYAPKGARLTLTDRTAAAWLWSRRRAVVRGLAAAALHGAKWVDASAPIELIYANNKSPTGVVARQETLLADEVRRLGEMAVTTAERTAFDLARCGSVVDAFARLDALCEVCAGSPESSISSTRVPSRRRNPGCGCCSSRRGFPRPQTQIPILAPDGYPRYFLDLGWPELKIAVEYDGEQHRTDRVQYRGDVTRSEYIEHLGWRRIRVLAGDRGPEVIRRVERVWPR